VLHSATQELDVGGHADDLVLLQGTIHEVQRLVTRLTCTRTGTSR
jgi:hypothetical protein